MNIRLVVFLLVATLFATMRPMVIFGQTVKGKVTDSKGVPVENVVVAQLGTTNATSTNTDGGFALELISNEKKIITFRHLSFGTKEVDVSNNSSPIVLDISLEYNSQMLKSVNITDSKWEVRNQAGLTKLDPKTAKALTSTFGDFNRILVTLPGVVSNNELSGQYSVRGGNFDENLVYVEGFEVYRPQLVRAGQQEGLSFINPDLVSSIEFSAGGWQPIYGDRLSSVLNVEYRKPDSNSVGFVAGLLTNRINVDLVSKSGNVTFSGGFRQKSGRYLYSNFLLFRGLEVEGEYFPNFIDFQGYTRIKLFENNERLKDRTTLGILTALAQNDYLVRPATRESTFGSLQQALRVFVAFVGEERLKYNTLQGGLKLQHRFNQKLTGVALASYANGYESEHIDVEGGYRLCDVQSDPSKPDFNQCISTRGVGTFYNYGRNLLTADVLQTSLKATYVPAPSHIFDFGVNYTARGFDDKLNEYRFIDSAEYVTITDTIFTTNQVNYQLTEFYAQHTANLSVNHSITYGARVTHNSFNGEVFFSPRLQYSFFPTWKRDMVFRLSTGIYNQPPFFREMRNFNGIINPEIRAQKSVHFIGGLDYNLKIWNRDFKLVAEAYYKHLTDVVPYDVDDIRIRYYGENNSVAYATGLDLRLSGEFIPAEQSWFSLSFLQTKENVPFDNRGFIPRPTNQFITLGIFFQDHLPNNPSLRISLNASWGTGLPLGPPNNPDLRNEFEMSDYRRLDIGFSKEFDFTKRENRKKINIKNMRIGLDILNAVGNANQISAFWIKDVNNISWAVPNTSSARFINLTLQGKF